MFNKNQVFTQSESAPSLQGGVSLTSLVGLAFWLVLTTNPVLAKLNKEVEMPVSGVEQTSQFSKIEQPLGLKVAVALGGLSLISAELWWFKFSKTKSDKS